MPFRPSHLSPSALSLFAWCPAQYHARYVLKRHDPPTVAQQFGLAVHRALEAHFRGDNPQQAFRRDWRDRAAGLVDLGIVVPPALTGRGMDLVDVVLELGLTGETEKPVTLNVGSFLPVPLYGIVDLWDAAANRIIDFKTTSGKWSQERADREVWQPAIYSAALWAGGDAELPSFEYVVMSRDTGRVDRFETHRTLDQVDAAIEQARTIYRRILAEDFPCTCHRCETVAA